MRFPFEITVDSQEDTADTARRFAEEIQGGDVIALTGNLGSGKTFFVNKICKYFGIENVSSPSFAIVNQYQNSLLINHFDFYRIKKEVELYDIGFNEYLSEPAAINFIEWADLFPELLPQKHFKVAISIIDQTKRKIEISKNE